MKNMLLAFDKTIALLAKYGIKTCKQTNCMRLEEVIKASQRIAPPWVLKVIAEEVFHKTEKDLIALDLRDADALVKAFYRLEKTAKKLKKASFLLQEQVKGVEVIIGSKRDENFGETLLYGSGGIFAELFKDTSIKLAPITRREAEEMINDTKSRAFFTSGFRGRKADKEKIIALLLKTSKLVEKEKIIELDFNPVIATPDEAFVVDAKIVKEDAKVAARKKAKK